MTKAPDVLDQQMVDEVLRQAITETLIDDAAATGAIPGGVFLRRMKPGEFDGLVNWILAQGIAEIQQAVPGVRVFVFVKVTTYPNGLVSRQPEYWVQYPEGGESE